MVFTLFWPWAETSVVAAPSDVFVPWMMVAVDVGFPIIVLDLSGQMLDWLYFACFPVNVDVLWAVVKQFWPPFRDHGWPPNRRPLVACSNSASIPPRLERHSNINGTPITAYKIVTILPSDVRGTNPPCPKPSETLTLF